ncbi:MAG TPA: hypothetical protein VEG44_00795 [Candidatus Acidoferrales bacterium]|nr:hypothetical protein [Candidatus Acidoferrales bacterium]
MKMRAIPLQLITALLGILLALPLRMLLLPLLITLPGLCIYLVYNNYRPVNPIECISFSLTFSLITVPFVACLLYFLTINIGFTGVALGILVVILSISSYVADLKTKDYHDTARMPPEITRDSCLKQLAIITISTLLALTVYIPLSNSYVSNPDGLVMHPTQASDLNFHLSIISRFINSPHIPVEDPYLANYYINYNWFMHVYMGILTILTGVHQFTMLKIIVPLLFFTLSMNIYLLARKIYNYGTALISTIIYTIGGGLAWILIVYFNPSDIFHFLIYQLGDNANIKYDQTFLFYLLPQTQSFALVILVFALFLWIKTEKNYNLRNIVVLSLILIALPYYHVITAFPLFASMGLFSIYTFIRYGAKSAYPTLIPLTVASLAMVPNFILTSNGHLSQITITPINYSLGFMLFTYGIIGILAFIGAYQSLKSKHVTPLIFFAVTTFAIMNIISLPLTFDTYRFLVYLYIPIAIFAGYYVSRTLLELKQHGRSPKAVVIKASVVTIALICALPTSVIMFEFYNGHSYLHVPNDELNAMDWIKSNTHKNSIFLEEPSTFPKIPLMTGRRLVFAGGLYTMQYHGIDRCAEINSILNESNATKLSSELKSLNVSYIFVGHEERMYRISSTVADGYCFEKVYDREMIQIYKVT